MGYEIVSATVHTPTNSPYFRGRIRRRYPMQIILQEKENYIVRFDRGEEVVSGLVQFAQTERLGAAQFTAIGAAREVVLSYYNLDSKQYEDNTITEDLEITGIIGNVAFMEHKPIIHAHGTFSRKNFSVVGGHIKKLVVSATCEVHLAMFNGQVERTYDEQTGLNLLK